MTTKILSGTYSSGYSLKSTYTGVEVTSTGTVTNPAAATYGAAGGTALTLPNGGLVINHGEVAGGSGAAGRDASATYLGYNQWQGTPSGQGGSAGAGVYAAKTANITNFSTISGGAGGYGGAGYSSGVGGYELPPSSGGTAAAAIVLKAGGTVTNNGAILGGAGGDGGSTTGSGGGDGGAAGAGVLSLAAARVTNHGLIVGGASGIGGGGNYFYFADGRSTPGAAGVSLQAGGTVANTGTISGGSTQDAFPIFYPAPPGDGIDSAGGLVVNGSTSNKTALIDGFVGVSLAGAGTIINFATIAAVGYSPQGGYVAGVAIKLGSSSDIVIAEGGSDLVGAIEGGGGTLELRAGATGTIDGISGLGKVGFTTGASWIFDGDNEIPTGLTVHTGSTIAVAGTLATFGHIAADMTVTGELAVTAGKALSLVGGSLTNLAAGTLTGGTFVVAAGGRLQLPDNAAITTLDATIELLGPGAGVQSLNTKSGHEVGLRSSLTAIGSTGVLEAAGGASFLTFNSIANDGTIEALGGTVVIAGAVSGAGSLEIGGGGKAILGGAFAEAVSFSTGVGELALNRSQGYGGTISGFSTTGTDSLDLRDIGFKSGTTKASYSGTTAGGVLTVTDGVHTAHIHFSGDYLASTWTLSAAAGGGTRVVDPAAGAAPRALLTAMAAFAPGHSTLSSRGVGAAIPAHLMLTMAKPGLWS